MKVMSTRLPVARQVALKALIDAEAKRATKRLKTGPELKAHCTFMAVTFVDPKTGDIHVIAGGQTPEAPADFYRRLMIMHAKAAAGMGDDD
jgi:fructose-1-phosphate kinase PfkB-like protein